VPPACRRRLRAAAGADHPGTLTSRNNLASTSQAAWDSERAIPLFEQALAGCVRVLGDDYPQTKTVHTNLAVAPQHPQ
jgi:hypothetical protein